MSAVPVAAPDRASAPTALRWSRAVRYLGAAAVIVVVASVVVPRLAPLNGPPQRIADINDRSGTPALIDQNHPWPRDINVCDTVFWD